MIDRTLYAQMRKQNTFEPHELPYTEIRADCVPPQSEAAHKAKLAPITRYMVSTHNVPTRLELEQHAYAHAQKTGTLDDYRIAKLQDVLAQCVETYNQIKRNKI